MLALKKLAPGTIKNLDWGWSALVSFASSNKFHYLTPELMNEFLASKAQFMASVALAKCARSAACWMADLRGFDRPVNRLTLKLVDSISVSYKKGDKPLLTESDVSKFLLPPSLILLVPSCLSLQFCFWASWPVVAYGPLSCTGCLSLA